MAKTTFSSLCFRESFNCLPLYLFVACHNHLRNALAILDYKIGIRKINKNNANLATLVGIDCAGRIKYGDALLQSQAAARSHLSLVSFGKGNAQACRYKTSLQWFQYDWFGYVGTQIHACRQSGSIRRQRVMRFIYYLNFHYNVNN